jgi:glyoxylase-like metal-dependent hydrolase (beta-lactamase superfamily II)
MRLSLLFALLLVATPTQAQERGPSAPPVTSSAAAILHAALDALGGDAAFEARQIAFAFEGVSFAGEQAHDPAERVATIARTDRFVVDLDANRATLHTESVFPGGIRFHDFAVFGEAGVAQVDLAGWRAGTDVTRAPAQVAAANLVAISRLLPHLVVQQALAAEDTWGEPGEAEIDGRPHRTVAYRDPVGTEVTLYLDAESHLLTRFESRAGAQPPGMVTFAEYRSVDGLMVATSRVQAVGGTVTQDVRLTHVDLHPHLHDAHFAVPGGYADPPAPGEPQAVAMGDGVYVLDHMPPFRYRSMFVEMEDHVVVLEAPLSAAYAELALDLIRRTVPEKPVRYILVTHHHGDHVGGVPTFAAEGAVLLVGEGADVALRRQFAALEDATIEVVSERRTLGEGPRRIEILPVPNDHARSNLAFYLPAQQLLFQGDLFYTPDRGPVPAAFAMSEALAEAIRDAGFVVATIVGVHGRPVTWAEFEASLAARRDATD